MVDLENFGAYGYRNFVRKFARVEEFTGTGVMWDGANGAISQPDYQGWLSAEETVMGVSTSGEDAVGGAGAYALQVTGQGDDGIQKIDVIILEGLIPVESTEKFNIIYSAQVVSLNAQISGNTSPVTLPANRGLVSVYPGTQPARIMAAILPGLGRTQMAVWRCPKNKYAEFNKIGVYPESNKPIIAQLFARNNIDQSWINVGQFDQDGFLAEPTWPNPEYISPGTDLCLVINSTLSTNASSLLWVKMHDIPKYEELLQKNLEEEEA